MIDRLVAWLNVFLKGNADARAPFARRDERPAECLGAVFARPCSLCDHKP